jgi:hypothetical protein
VDRGGIGSTVTAPSATCTPLPASAACIAWRANTHAGCSAFWYGADTLHAAE